MLSLSSPTLLRQPCLAIPRLWSPSTLSHYASFARTRAATQRLSTSAHASTLRKPGSSSFAWKAGGLATAGLGLSLWSTPKLYCEPNPGKAGAVSSTPAPANKTPAPGPTSATPLPPPPRSSVSYLELTFGTVCGVCAGIFVKKGVKAVAFIFGGVFVLLQYLGSVNLVRIDWSRAANRFENLFYRKDAVTGEKHPPSVGSLFRWIIDFLTADFQQRASFIAGFTLGLRIG